MTAIYIKQAGVSRTEQANNLINTKPFFDGQFGVYDEPLNIRDV